MAFKFLPTNLKEANQKGWQQLDIILVSGDAYVDHPSFGASFIGRYLEDKGYRVGIISQPDWKADQDFLSLGAPGLFFAVTAGNLDSMIANYTAEKKRRKKDLYTPGGQPGKRPDRATIVYTNKLKQLFPETPIILGGIEASLRRIVHYDFWSDALRKPLLIDSKASALVYGLGEESLVKIARKIESKKNSAVKLSGELICANIPNSCYLSASKPKNSLELGSYEQLITDKRLFADNALLHARELSKKQPGRIIQQVGQRFVVIEPPKQPAAKEYNSYWKLPFTREIYPGYRQDIPAYSFVRFSINSHRGCFGGCSFCTLTAHQGRQVISRSEESVLNELEKVLIKDPEFKGVIQDVGGPSADMYQSHCTMEKECSRLSCLQPEICAHLEQNQLKHLELLQKVKSRPEVKQVFVNSGIRFDYALQCPRYIEGIAAGFTSGQLSVAPEHINEKVLKLMQKPGFTSYQRFAAKFDEASKKFDKQQYLIPYFIASHPGTTLQDMLDLALYLRQNNLKYEQAQNFMPIPMSMSAAMYYSEYDPLSKRNLHVAKGRERELQKALLQPHLKSNHKLIKEALEALHRTDLLHYLRFEKGYKKACNKVKYSKKPGGKNDHQRRAK